MRLIVRVLDPGAVITAEGIDALGRGDFWLPEWYNWTMKKTWPVKFKAGHTSELKWVKHFLTPLFNHEVIKPFPGAEFYTIAYGDLCAYDGKGELLATWSVVVPDCEQDAVPGESYSGKWELYYE